MELGDLAMIKTYNVAVNGICYEVEVEEVTKSNKVKSMDLIDKNNKINEQVKSKIENSNTNVKSNDKVDKMDNNSKENIFSPMPGVVNKINVSKNQSVSRGDILLILEAMKMENEIVSPVDGVIKDIHISEKSTVNSGELLISIE